MGISVWNIITVMIYFPEWSNNKQYTADKCPIVILWFCIAAYKCGVIALCRETGPETSLPLIELTKNQIVNNQQSWKYIIYQYWKMNCHFAEKFHFALLNSSKTGEHLTKHLFHFALVVWNSKKKICFDCWMHFL